MAAATLYSAPDDGRKGTGPNSVTE